MTNTEKSLTIPVDEEEKKSLYNVAQKWLDKENLNTTEKMLIFQEKISTEIDDIESQLKTAEASGATLNRRHKSGTDGFIKWQRKAESSRNIKRSQLRILERKIDAFNVKKETKWRRKYQQQLEKVVVQDDQLEILTQALNNALDSMEENGSEESKAYEILRNALEAARNAKED